MTPSTSILKDPLSEFKKGMRRDATLFPILKDKKQWDVYQLATKAQARAPNLSDVLDDTYVPTAPIDIQLFKLKQEFMYSVAECTLLRDNGKTCVHSHEADYDEQKIYAGLFDYMNKFTKADLSASDLLSYITSTCI
jgi:hypothetical protein